MNEDETRSAPWQRPEDEPTRMTTTHEVPAPSVGSGGADDWYRSSLDDHDGFAVSHDGPHGPRTHGSHDGYATPRGYPSHGSSSLAPRYAPQPQGPQKRPAWMAPLALGVVALVSFGAVTALMTKDSSPKQTAPPVVSNSVAQSISPSSTMQGSSPSTVTTTTTAPAPAPTPTTQQQPVTTTSSSTEKTAVAFPAGMTTRCMLNDGTFSTVSDPDVRQRTKNSCDFLPAVKNAVWDHESSSNDASFTLKVRSSYRVAQNETKAPDKKEDPMVPLRCTRSAGLTECVSNEQTNRHDIDIWVRDAS